MMDSKERHRRSSRRPAVSAAVALAGAWVAAAGWVGAADPPAPLPNIVLVMVDDMGFSDLGCYGSEIETPNLDRLAAGGVRFSDFHNTGRCCPTRASLLTGLYPHEAGVGWMTADWGHPGYRGFLRADCPTIAEVLRPAGFFTIMTGKWHVGAADGQRPAQRGFDRSYAIPEGGGFYFRVKPGRTIRRNDTVVHGPDGPPLPDGWYSTDAWTDEGLGFVDEALRDGKPFFWYLAHNAPHFPLQAPEPTIAKYRGRFRIGWDAVRRERHARQSELGLFPVPVTLAPRDPVVPAWESLDEGRRDRLDHRMAVYAAVVEQMDRAMGRLVEGLRERGVLENTLILFLSDNGGCAEGGLFGKDGKGAVGSAESNVFCGRAWAHAQDTPFRFYKHWVHEGGTATPLVAHWPARITEPGRIDHTPGHVVDLMATCADVAGAAFPSEADGRATRPMRGRSLVPILEGRAVERDGPLFWEHEGNRAVRLGSWKLVAEHGGDWELYDLATDRNELQNLAGDQPDRVRELAARYAAWAEGARVLPWDEVRRRNRN